MTTVGRDARDPPPRTEWLAALHSSAAAGLLVVDVLEGPVYLNAEAERLLGRGLRALREGWRPSPPAEWLARLGEPTADGPEHPLEGALAHGREKRATNLRLITPDRGRRVFDLIAKPAGRVVVCTLIDRILHASDERWAREVELRAAQLDAATVRREARTDPLTGLLNRRGFDEAYDRVRALAGQVGASFGVVVCDLDNFKPVNDQLGHEVGDHVLEQVTGLLRKTTRATDKLARVGGDEFVVLLPDADEELVRLIAARLREQVRVEVGALTVTTSVGAARCGASDSSDPIALADAAMYAAKAARRAAMGRPEKQQYPKFKDELLSCEIGNVYVLDC